MAEASRDKFQPEKPVAVLILQGTDDPLVPYDGGEINALGSKPAGIIATDDAVKKWVEHNGCQREAVTEELADKDSKMVAA